MEYVVKTSCLQYNELFVTAGPANLPPPTQQFKKNFPSLEEREARGTKRTIGNEGHHDSAPVVPFTEMDNTSSK